MRNLAFARSLGLLFVLVVCTASGSASPADAALSASPQAGDVDLSFFPVDSGSAINGTVWAVGLQSDGKVLFGGDFTLVNGSARNHIARLNADSSIDDTFLDGPDGPNSRVFCLAVQPDGRILIGGEFTTVDGLSRTRIARLSADGSLDTTFLNGLTGASGGNFPAVRALAVQSDGRVLIGGDFTTVNGVSHNGIARLNSDGSLDTSFHGGFDEGSTLYAFAVQPDGRVLIGGLFYNDNGGVGTDYLLRLNSDGSRDTTFLNGLSGPAGPVASLSLQPDGRLLIGGNFGLVNGVERSNIARLNTDGSLDANFVATVEYYQHWIYCMAVQPNGQVLIGGDFVLVNGVERHALARLNADGSLDTTFSGGLGEQESAYSLAVQSDGRVLVGGNLFEVNGVARSYLARLNADGSLDTAFLNRPAAGLNDTVYALALQPDGRVLIGGAFTAVNEVSRNGIARLNTDGSLDSTFLNGLAGMIDGLPFAPQVFALAVQPDGRVLIGGAFTSVDGVSRNNVARLNADGSLDPTFLNEFTGTNTEVGALAVQPDGRVLIGGFFTSVNGITRNRIARLNADGSLDSTFLSGLAGANDFVSCVAVQPDGRVLIGGNFLTVNGVSRRRIARLNADGSLDTTFLNGLPGVTFGLITSVDSLALQPDGRVLIGGDFGMVNGVSRVGIARLNADGSLDTSFLGGLAVNESPYVKSVALQPDGRVLIGGFFQTVNAVSRNNVARLNSDGSLDTTFLNALTGASDVVYTLALQPDGRVVMGGVFDAVNGVPRTRLARLYGSVPIAPAITIEPSAQASYDGCCATFEVTATGSFLEYRWRKDGVDLEAAPGISGAHTATLTLTGVTLADEGDYSVVVSNVVGTDISLDARLTVAAVPECRVTSCDPVLGCVLTDAEDGTDCSDGDACTTGDTCAGGSCVGGAPVICAPLDQCHVAGVCNASICSNPTAPDGSGCDDGNTSTDDDVCTAGVCAGSVSCAVEPKPKSYGYYKSLCKDGHSHPSTHEDLLTDADAACVGSLTDSFAGVSTVDDVCAVLEDKGGSGDGYDSKECVKGEQELMATALNVCRQRVCLAQEIDSHCGADPHQSVLTSVQASLDAADDILADPARNKDVCNDAKCLAKEVNNGHGIHHTSLLLTKDAGGKVRLTWDSPVMDDGTGEATGYTIWRRDLRSPLPFTRVGTTNANTTSFLDATQGVFEYEVTFTIEP